MQYLRADLVLQSSVVTSSPKMSAEGGKTPHQERKLKRKLQQDVREANDLLICCCLHGYSEEDTTQELRKLYPEHLGALTAQEVFKHAQLLKSELDLRYHFWRGKFHRSPEVLAVLQPMETAGYIRLPKGIWDYLNWFNRPTEYNGGKLECP